MAFMRMVAMEEMRHGQMLDVGDSTANWIS